MCIRDRPSAPSVAPLRPAAMLRQFAGEEAPPPSVDTVPELVGIIEHLRGISAVGDGMHYALYRLDPGIPTSEREMHRLTYEQGVRMFVVGGSAADLVGARYFHSFLDDGGGPTQLLTLDALSGAVISARPVPAMLGLVYDHATSHLLGLSIRDGGSRLLRVNPEDGTWRELNSFDGWVTLGAMTLDAARRRLYVPLGQEPGHPDLLIVDADTGLLLDTVPTPQAFHLDFDGLRDRLVGMAPNGSGSSDIVTWSPQTQQWTVVMSIGGFYNVGQATMDPRSGYYIYHGRLDGVESQQVIAVDVDLGQVIGAISVPGHMGLEFVGPVQSMPL